MKLKNKVIIFGAGDYGKDAYQCLKDDHEVVCFADNRNDIAVTLINGVPVVPGADIKNYLDDDTDIVVAVMMFGDITDQFLEMDITEWYHLFDGHLYPRNRHFQEGGEVRRCKRCIMDEESDRLILFDEAGYCNYCNSALEEKKKIYFPNSEGDRKLKEFAKRIKEENRDSGYDCVMGISGGLDSSYLAYIGYKLGLRVLAVHIDDGYDTEISKANLKKLIEKTGFDYEVVAPNEEQFNDLSLAYMKAGVPNIAVPQDNLIFSYIYKRMREENIKYFLSGGNFALECILQRGNTYGAFDVNNILAIHKRFGKGSIDKLDLLSKEQMIRDQKELGIESPRPLNWIDYNRDRAFSELKDFCGFEYYGRKHLENIFTAFTQLVWFPQRFGVDKRKSHLSSMIMSDQMTREQALELMEEPMYDEKMMSEYIAIIKQHLGITDAEYEEIMRNPPHQHEEYI